MAATGLGAMSLYVLEDGQYTCTTAEGRPMCLKGNMQPTGQQTPDQVMNHMDEFDPTYQGTRQVAGQSAQCFTVKPKAGARSDFADATVCLNPQGIPLLMHSRAAGSEMTMEATSFSTSVSDADFQLPAPVLEMPQMPGMPQIPGLPGGIPGAPGSPR